MDLVVSTTSTARTTGTIPTYGQRSFLNKLIMSEEQNLCTKGKNKATQTSSCLFSQFWPSASFIDVDLNKGIASIILESGKGSVWNTFVGDSSVCAGLGGQWQTCPGFSGYCHISWNLMQCLETELQSGRVDLSLSVCFLSTLTLSSQRWLCHYSIQGVSGLSLSVSTVWSLISSSPPTHMKDCVLALRTPLLKSSHSLTSSQSLG